MSVSKTVKSKNTTKTQKAGLTFPVGRIGRFLKNGRYAKRVGAKAPIALAATLEYLISEIIELSGNLVKESKKTRITPRHICLAVRSDEELARLMNGVTFPTGGVIPSIHESLDKKKN